MSDVFKSQIENMDGVYRALFAAAEKIYGELKKGEGLKFATSSNESGDDQIELDVIADEAFFETLSKDPAVRYVVSEERPDMIRTSDGPYSVALDPLDGSKSALIGIGLYLDATGEVPSNRMLDVYKSEEEARRVFGAVTQWIIERKDHFGAFWNNATEATAAFKDAGCVIGQTWDTTGLLLNRENPEFIYRAPKEGIITWLDSFGIMREAENVDQAVAFMNFMLTPEVGGMFSNNTGYNSAVAGAAAEDEPPRPWQRTGKAASSPLQMTTLRVIP